MLSVKNCMPTFVRHMRDDYHYENGEKITHKEILLNLDNVEFIEFSNIYSDQLRLFICLRSSF